MRRSLNGRTLFERILGERKWQNSLHLTELRSFTLVVLTKVDTTGMAQVGAGVSGVVGVIGEADYGEPYDPAHSGSSDRRLAPKVYEIY